LPVLVDRVWGTQKTAGNSLFWMAISNTSIFVTNIEVASEKGVVADEKRGNAEKRIKEARLGIEKSNARFDKLDREK
jgi:hypothetical protein